MDFSVCSSNDICRDSYHNRKDKMKVQFITSDLINILSINGWSEHDKFDIKYDELDGEKRIIITKEEE